jgi:hypothetical protein
MRFAEASGVRKSEQKLMAEGIAIHHSESDAYFILNQAPLVSRHQQRMYRASSSDEMTQLQN